MALVHYTFTIPAGAAKSLLELAALEKRDDVGMQFITLQLAPAVNNAAYIGGPGVTSTNYGQYMPAPAAAFGTAGQLTESPRKFEMTGGRPVKLSEIYVAGTVGDEVHVCALPW